MGHYEISDFWGVLGPGMNQVESGGGDQAIEVEPGLAACFLVLWAAGKGQSIRSPAPTGHHESF